MRSKILVAYATKYGATAEIAEKIGEVLSQAGVSVDVLPVSQVKDPGSYGAVVLGSAVYIGRWRKEASRFLKANQKLLAERPLWIFSSGPTGKGDPVELTEGWRFPKALQPLVDSIKPRAIVVFHGAIDTNKMKPLEKWMIEKVGAATEDSRDWDSIASWAKAIASAVAAELGQAR
ncbi:MAG: flavodoxin domain-containing protein [Spirochaetaceae bacterium]|nr:MAG: flavodoxin domain-containing protein [Spirochaetaceae bacterium]